MVYLHWAKPVQGRVQELTQCQWVQELDPEMFTLVRGRDRKQDQWYSIFPVPVPVSVLSVLVNVRNFFLYYSFVVQFKLSLQTFIVFRLGLHVCTRECFFKMINCTIWFEKQNLMYILVMIWGTIFSLHQYTKHHFSNWWAHVRLTIIFYNELIDVHVPC